MSIKIGDLFCNKIDEQESIILYQINDSNYYINSEGLYNSEYIVYTSYIKVNNYE